MGQRSEEQLNSLLQLLSTEHPLFSPYVLSILYSTKNRKTTVGCGQMLCSPSFLEIEALQTTSFPPACFRPIINRQPPTEPRVSRAGSREPVDYGVISILYRNTLASVPYVRSFKAIFVTSSVVLYSLVEIHASHILPPTTPAGRKMLARFSKIFHSLSSYLFESVCSIVQSFERGSSATSAPGLNFQSISQR